MEACWAHNPEVRRSKLRSAIVHSLLSAESEQDYAKSVKLEQ